MADYWGKLKDGNETYPCNSLGQLVAGRNVDKVFFAKGKDIVFEDFFSVSQGGPVYCIVKETCISEIILEKSSHRYGYDNEIEFSNCEIGRLRITGLKLSTITFNNCTISNIEIEDHSTINELIIKAKTIIKQITLKNSIGIKERIQVSESSTLESVLINGARITSLILIDSKLVNFKCINVDIISSFSITNCSFNKIEILKGHLHSALEISECQNGSLEVNEFDYDGSFISVRRCSISITFCKVKFNKDLAFQIDESKQSKLSYKRCYFSGEVKISGDTFESERNLIVVDTIFKELVRFDYDNAKSVKIKESLFQNGVSIPIDKCKKTTDIDSTVWCILKNQALEKNQNISAFEYRKNELKSYSKELKISGGRYQERFVLWLNKISNNHGINWFKGILFTLATWLIFYSLFTMITDEFYCLTHRGCKFLFADVQFWSGAIEYLWLPQGLSELTEGLSKHSSILVITLMILSFFVGKILIAYGIFQTISAFRRHGKA
jgi:hypothetical protein